MRLEEETEICKTSVKILIMKFSFLRPTFLFTVLLHLSTDRKYWIHVMLQFRQMKLNKTTNGN